MSALGTLYRHLEASTAPFGYTGRLYNPHDELKDAELTSGFATSTGTIRPSASSVVVAYHETMISKKES